MQSYMAADLKQIFTRDMPAECKIGAVTYSVLLDDLLGEEQEAYGGPENIDLQRVHFQTTDKGGIVLGSKLSVRPKPQPGATQQPWKSKIVLSFVISADGNELIVTVRGD